jgi:hypothetical protein
MAFAITAAKVYPVDVNTPLRNHFEQVVEMTVTAANTDTALALATVAASDLVEGPYITKVLSMADKIIDYFIFESPRAVSASGAAHALSGTAVAPTFTFAGSGSTPTSMSFFIRFKLAADRFPITYNVT